jgi:hypothetical protein
MAEFEQSGVRFQYPENWRLEREHSDTGWTVTVQGPGTAFVMVCLREDAPDPVEVADSVLATLSEDYPGLEAEARVDTLAGRPAVGHDIRFFSLDLTNTCWTRSVSGTQGTVLVLCQATDLELEEAEPVLRAICASLTVEDL